MNIIWSAIFIFSVLFACIKGTPELVLTSITNNSKVAIENTLLIAGMLIFWNGLFNILSNTKVLDIISKKVYGLVSFLFKKNEVTDKAKEYISLNITSNLLGIGNAATINSLKGMEELGKNSKKLNKSMATFILLNTCSIQLIPTSMISLRMLYGANNPENIVIPVIIISFASLIVSIIFLNIFWRFYD